MQPTQLDQNQPENLEIYNLNPDNTKKHRVDPELLYKKIDTQ